PRSHPRDTLPCAQRPGSAPLPYTSLFRSQRQRSPRCMSSKAGSKSTGTLFGSDLSSRAEHLISDVTLSPFLPAPLVYSDHKTILDRMSTRLNSSPVKISYAVSCLRKKRDR